MLIKNASVAKGLETLQNTHVFNVMIAAMWLDFLKTETSFTTAKALSKTMKEQRLDLNQAFIYQFLAALDLDSLRELDKKNIQSRIRDSIQPLSIQDYRTNPYYQTVKPKPIQLDNWAITYQTLSPFQGCVYDDVRIDPSTFTETTPIGYVDQPFSYLAIQQDDTTWMSVTPFEIHTMEPILNTLHGHVVALGLGLGYFAFMAALNPKVSHITVIEKDKTAIALFLKYIFPFFPYPSKITIIHQDALDYVSLVKENVDHLFVDIYHTADDGLPLYLKIKRFEPHWKNTIFSYWLEHSMIGLLRRYLFISLSLDGMDSLNDYPHWAQTLLKAFNLMHEHVVLETLDDVHHWFSTENIHSIIQKLPSF
jgi:hypothetical protein